MVLGGGSDGVPGGDHLHGVRDGDVLGRLHGGGAAGALAAGALVEVRPALADIVGSPLCDEACAEKLAAAELVTTESGLQYKDIVVGDGPQCELSFQVVVDYVAANDKGQIFENTVEKGQPVDVRVTGDKTTSSVIAGLDEGLSTMNVGGIRRLYIPGELAFPKGLSSAPGRPRIPPNTPVTFDVWLRYIPGLE